MIYIMMNNDAFAIDAIPRRVLHLIFLVDTSGSMQGAKIASLNTAVREALNDVGEISRNNSDAQVKVAALEFASDVRWMYPQPQDSETFRWIDLKAGGLTSLGAAYNELNGKLSRSHGFMAEPAGVKSPAVILITDGQPTDGYKSALSRLKGNPWFQVGIKIAIAVGDEETNIDTLTEFTGNREAVITVHNVEQLKKIIHAVSVSITESGTKGSSAVGSANAPKSPSDEVNENLKAAIANDPVLESVDQGDRKPNSGMDAFF